MVDVDARTDAKHVVIVSGGFAGLACASRLAAHGNIKITLIDKNNYQQFQPLLYQVAASILSPSNAAFALRDLFRNQENVDVHMDEVAFVDLRKRTVRTAAGKTFAWLGIHAALLTTARAKLEAIIDWAWEYFLGEHAGQIIHPLESDLRNLPIWSSHVATSAGK
jgi:NADH dehydrogenase FAD-containing subunit